MQGLGVVRGDGRRARHHAGNRLRLRPVRGRAPRPQRPARPSRRVEGQTYEEELGAEGPGEGRQKKWNRRLGKAIALCSSPLQLRPALHRRRKREEDHARSPAARQARLQHGGPARRDRALEREASTTMASADASRSASRRPGPPSSDALVFFGATGDLAYKKIFPSLQGHDPPREPARPGHRRREVGLDDRTAPGPGAREPEGARRRRRRGARSRSSLPCSSTSTATTAIRPRSRLAQGPRRGEAPDALPRHPAQPVRYASSSARQDRAARTGARVVIEKPFGHDFAPAHALNQTLHTVFPESRRSSASTTTWARRPSRTSCSSASPTRSSSRSGTATTWTASRSRWPRSSACRAGASSTTRPARSGTSSRTTCSRSSDTSPWSRRTPSTRTGSATNRSRSSARSSPLKPEDVVRGQFDRLPERARRQGRLHGRDLRGRPPRDRLLALGGRAVLHPGRKVPAADGDGGAGRPQDAPALAPLPAGEQLLPLPPRAEDLDLARRPGQEARREDGVHAHRARRRPTDLGADELDAYERLLTDAMEGIRRCSSARTRSRPPGRSSKDILDDATPVHPYAPGTWGPAGGGPADRRPRGMARPRQQA